MERGNGTKQLYIWIYNQWFDWSIGFPFRNHADASRVNCTCLPRTRYQSHLQIGEMCGYAVFLSHLNGQEIGALPVHSSTLKIFGPASSSWLRGTLCRWAQPENRGERKLRSYFRQRREDLAKRATHRQDKNCPERFTFFCCILSLHFAENPECVAHLPSPFLRLKSYMM